jgi:hypothetical protein
METPAHVHNPTSGTGARRRGGKQAQSLRPEQQTHSEGYENAGLVYGILSDRDYCFTWSLVSMESTTAAPPHLSPVNDALASSEAAQPFLLAPLGSGPTHAIPGLARGSRPRGNLCMESQSRGLRIGVIGFGVTLALAIAFAKLGVSSELRWLLAAPFFVSVVGVSESLLQTCPFLALQSLCDHGDGLEPIPDPKERALMRARGKRLLLACASLSLVAAGLFAQLPF